MKTSDKKGSNLFSEQVGEKEKRKLRAQHRNKRSIWFGLGMFGMVGWSVSVPALLGAVLGMWLDKIYPQTFSWTLSFLIMGLFVGCLIAWHWIAKEHKDMNSNKEEKDE
ncbi:MULTISPECIES: AtpZ/AtpI family protein [unclassified Flavobacterium]|jgi:ATP synthase protein I|uniref:AtpZ/AtpI family protein n=1 Tax=unclassified Flavobacterium TaxID=196869 RepID=UPI0025C1282F|nr:MULTISPECIES: AtpZ/AtpI family protein [unclassified Flavobacterium]